MCGHCRGADRLRYCRSAAAPPLLPFHFADFEVRLCCDKWTVSALLLPWPPDNSTVLGQYLIRRYRNRCFVLAYRTSGHDILDCFEDCGKRGSELQSRVTFATALRGDLRLEAKNQNVPA